MNSLVKLFFDGGIVIMTAILACSVVAVAIIVERFAYYKKISKNDDNIVDRIMNAINAKRFDEALSICDTMPTPVTNLMKAGIKYRDFTDVQIQEAIKDAASLEIPKLEKYLTTLGSIASIAPLLGLLGTVMGNMEALGVLGNKALIGNMEMLSQGIAKALITTAFGLVIAIPTTVFYNHLTNKVNNMILQLEIKANELVLLLVKGKKGGADGNKV